MNCFLIYFIFYFNLRDIAFFEEFTTNESFSKNGDGFAKNIISLDNLKKILSFKNFKNCQQLKEHYTNAETGIYYIYPNGYFSPVMVKCIMTEKNGYTVIQTRKNPFESWHKPWNSYKNGFGDVENDFWLGNDVIHKLTNQKKYSSSLIIRLGSNNHEATHDVQYDKFSIADESASYSLRIGSQIGGIIGDSLSYHRNAKFSTYDRDNDENDGSCSMKYGYGFWFRSCYMASLNGRPSSNQSIIGSINWSTWLGFNTALFESQMLIQHSDLQNNLENSIDCYDIILGESTSKSGRYSVILNDKTYNIICDMETEGGGWNVIQRRGIDYLDFNKNLGSYIEGFGNLDKDFWFSLSALSYITQKRTYSVRFEFTTENDILFFQEYKNFLVGKADDNFRLSIGEPSKGNAGDSMEFHNEQIFTVASEMNNLICTEKCAGGWWFADGHRANLNGLLERKRSLVEKSSNNFFNKFFNKYDLALNSSNTISYKHSSWDKVTGYRPIIETTRILIRRNEKS